MKGQIDKGIVSGSASVCKRQIQTQEPRDKHNTVDTKAFVKEGTFATMAFIDMSKERKMAEL